MPLPPVSSATEEELKQKGNALFAAGKYDAARVLYSEALALLPSPPPADRTALASTLLSNRAQAARALDNWAAVEADARLAADHDRSNAKAFYLHGLALLRRGEHRAGLAALDKARAAAEKRAGGAAGGGKAGGAAGAGAPARAAAALLAQLDDALAAGRAAAGAAADAAADADDAAALDAVHAALEAARGAGHAAPDAARARLDGAFEERAAARADRRVPDHLVCGITLDIMVDPVVTPAGHSYERAAIVEYLTTGKAEDPRTREPLTLAQLVPNLALKAACAEFLRAHPWAHPRADSVPAIRRPPPPALPEPAHAS